MVVGIATDLQRHHDDQPGADVQVQNWVRADLAELDALLAAQPVPAGPR